MPLQIYLDLDGVLSDWEGAVCDWAGKPKTPWLSWHYHRELGISDAELEDYMSYVSFWDGLKPLKKGMELWASLVSTFGEDAVTIATTPFPHGNALFGKDKWTQKYLKWKCDKVIYIKDKGRLAQPGSVLIDDGKHQIESFRARGGYGILYCRSWNSNQDLVQAQTVESIIQEIKNYQGTCA